MQYTEKSELSLWLFCWFMHDTTLAFACQQLVNGFGL